MERSSSESGDPAVASVRVLLRETGNRAVFSGRWSAAIAEHDGLRSLATIRPDAFPNVIIMVADDRDVRLVDVRRWTLELGGALSVVNDAIVSPGPLARRLLHFDLCIVDADLLGDAEDTVDYCLRLRMIAPRMPILLLSSEVRAHDLTAERMAICDATLRMPVSRIDYLEGVNAAVQNTIFRLSRNSEPEGERDV